MLSSSLQQWEGDGKTHSGLQRFHSHLETTHSTSDFISLAKARCLVVQQTATKSQWHGTISTYLSYICRQAGSQLIQTRLGWWPALSFKSSGTALCNRFPSLPLESGDQPGHVFFHCDHRSPRGQTLLDKYISCTCIMVTYILVAKANHVTKSTAKGYRSIFCLQ